VLLEMRVNFVLNFCDFVQVLNADTPSDVLPRLIRAFLKTCGFLYEPRGGRRLHDKFEASIDVGLKDDAHRHFSVVLACAIIELLAKLHHVDTEGTKGLTDLWGWLGHSGIYIEAHRCFVSRTRIHFVYYIIIASHIPKR
jgi:hypothetical protein